MNRHVLEILAKHHILDVFDEWKSPDQVYKAIADAGDPLTFHEHEELFDIFWEEANRSRNPQFVMIESLKQRLITCRAKAASWWTLYGDIVQGKIGPDNMNKILHEYGLSEAEKMDLWWTFHNNYPGFSTRSLAEIDRTLDLCKHVRGKLRIFGKIKVLDLGCGKNARAISELVKEFAGKVEGYGVDSVILEQPPNVHVMIGTATRLPFRDETFEVVYSLRVLQYLNDEEKRKALEEICRILKKGGIFIEESREWYLAFKTLPAGAIRGDDRSIFFRKA
jgi:hypothetical protein